MQVDPENIFSNSTVINVPVYVNLSEQDLMEAARFETIMNKNVIGQAGKRRVSTFGNDKKHCLCYVLKPLFVIWQIFGIFPITHNPLECSLTHSICSFPSQINYIWLATISVLSTWVLYNMRTILATVVTGTDFYTFIATTMIGLCSSIVLYVAGGCGARHLAKGWYVLHHTVEELALPNFKLVQRSVYFIPILILEGFTVDLSSMLYSYMNDDLKIENVAIMLPSSLFMFMFIPNLICGSYTVLLWIVAINFNAINNEAKLIMDEFSNFAFPRAILVKSRDKVRDGGGKVRQGSVSARKLAMLRVLHENLCTGVRHLQKAFGVQVLVIFCSTGFSFVGGIYGFIIATNGLMSSAKLTNLTIAFAITSMLSGFRLLLILVICQYLTNKSSEIGHILNSYNEMELFDEELKKEVDTFRRKVGQFPLKMSCCNIFPLSTSIFSSASGNIITYVLVLMQFKLNSIKLSQ